MATSDMALYYPWMHFQDDSWLKTSLLTWEKVVRVRPHDIEDRDDDLVRRIGAETDLLVEIVPSDRDLEAVAEAFTDVISQYQARISSRWTVSDSDSARYMPDLEFMMPSSQYYLPHEPISVAPRRIFVGPEENTSIPNTSLTWVYSGAGGSKIGSVLQEYLIDVGVAAADPDGGPWTGMRPKLASIYMAALADAVASHNYLVPTTDDPRMHSALGAINRLTDLLLERRSEVVHPDPAGAYIHLALNCVLEPRNIASVPIERLISFRQKHEAELRAFWIHVAGLADELADVSAVDNIELAQLHMQGVYDSQTKPLLRELQSGLRAYGVDSIAGSMALKINISAASGTILGAAALAGGHVALGAASVAITVVPYWYGRLRTSRARRAASPVAYLLAANRELSGQQLLRSLL